MKTVLIVGLAFLLPHLVLAQDAPPAILSPQFSAEVIFTEAQKTTNLKIFADGDKFRIEQAYGIILMRRDEKKMMMLMPQNKMAVNMPYADQKVSEYQTLTSTGKYKYLGPDSVEGLACSKYELTSEKGDVSYLWSDIAKKVPVKWMSADGKRAAILKNYVTGPQDPQLFEIPPDYTSVNVPGAVIPGQ